MAAGSALPDPALSSGSDAEGKAGPPFVTPRHRHVVAASNQRPPKPKVTDQTAYTGRTLTYTVPEVTDPDGDTLTYSAFLGPSSNPLPDWLTFNADTRTFTAKPRNAHVGDYEIIVMVEDQSLTNQASFTLTVEVDTNKAPTASDDTATVAEGGKVAIAASTLLANDSDPMATPSPSPPSAARSTARSPSPRPPPPTSTTARRPPPAASPTPSATAPPPTRRP